MTDVYVLASERSTAIAKRFIDTWVSDFDETASEYEFPQYSDKPFVVYSSPTELIQKLVEVSNEPHSIYWNNPKSDILMNGMLFFTKDGAMIAGVTVNTDDFEEIARYLKELSKIVGGRFGYAVFEEPPVETVKEFIDAVKAMPTPKLFEGSLIV